MVLATKPTADRRTLNREEAMKRFELLVAQGVPVSKAILAVGRTRQTYENWRRRYPEWAASITGLRARIRDATWTGYDLVEFRQGFFGRDTPEHHAVMVEAIEESEPDSITMILAPPESGKSSLLVDYYCYRLGPVDPSTRICLIAESQSLSRKILGQVATRMTDRQMFDTYIRAFGPFKMDPADRKRGGVYDRDVRQPWNADYFRVLKAQLDEKDWSFEALGAGSQIYGGRYDLIVLDDIQSTKNLNQTAQLLDWFRKMVLTRPAKGKGKTIIVGTRIGPGDFYETLLNEDAVDRLVKIPALDRDLPAESHYSVERDSQGRKRIKVNPDAPATSYWPGYWTMEDLAKRRDKVGEATWATVYMQKAVSQAGTSFPEDVIDAALDKTLGWRDARARGLDKLAACDPALAGPAAFAVCSYDFDRLVVCGMETRENLGRNEAILNHIESLSADMRPSAWAIENDGAGKALFEDDRLDLIAQRWGFSKHPQQTARNKTVPNFGVTAMAAAMRAGEIVLPYGDDPARTHIDPLVDELRRWRPDVAPKMLRQDRVMALWFMWRLWRVQREYLDVGETYEWRPTWMGRSDWKGVAV